MKKLFLILIGIYTFAFSAVAQEESITRTEIIAPCVSVKITYNNQMVPIDSLFSFYAQNLEYSYLSDIFMIETGTAQDVYDTIEDIIAFGEKYNDNGIKIKYEKYELGIIKTMGSKAIVLDINGKWHMFRMADINLIKKKFLKYCKKNDISINIE